MKVRLNGEERSVDSATTVADAVALLTSGPAGVRGIAVALNGEVVARSQWNEVRLSADDRVEVLRAVGGG